MIQRRHKLKVLCLSLLTALGLMAFTATTAQSAGEFRVLGKGITETQTFTASDYLVLLSPAFGLEIDCTGFNVIEGKLSTEGTGEAKILYSGCLYRQLANLAKHLGANCKIKDGEVEGDITAQATLSVILLKDAEGKETGKAYVLAKGNGGGPSGNRFALVHSTGCSVPELFEVKGTIALEVSELEAISQIVQAAPESVQLELGDELKLGTQKAELDGNVSVRLTTTSSFCNWGVE